MTLADKPDAGKQQFDRLIDLLPMVDPRDDIDTASLVGRFPHLTHVTVSDIHIAGPHGPVHGRLYEGESRIGPGLVWVHGGAFVSGSLDMPESHWVALELASRGIPVLALDYQKALNGIHHPVLSDEVLAGWQAAPALLGLPPSRLHLGGASAGANLVAGVAGRLLAASQPLPATLILVYPVLHDEVPAASAATAPALQRVPPELRFSPGFMRAININYVGDPLSLSNPVAFPAHGATRGLPPTFILTAEADDLRPSGEEYALQLQEAGVEVSCDYEPGTVHGYLDMPGLAAAVTSIEKIAGWMTRAELAR